MSRCVEGGAMTARGNKLPRGVQKIRIARLFCAGFSVETLAGLVGCTIQAIEQALRDVLRRKK